MLFLFVRCCCCCCADGLRGDADPGTADEDYNGYRISTPSVSAVGRRMVIPRGRVRLMAWLGGLFVRKCVVLLKMQRMLQRIAMRHATCPMCIASEEDARIPVD